MTDRPTRRLAAVLAADLVPGGKTPPDRREMPGPPSLVPLLAELGAQPEIQVVDLSDRELLLVVDTADAGVHAGIALLRAGRDPLAAAGYRMRVGLHAGEVIEDAGGIRGSPLEVAQRLRDRAEPGQIILSELTFRLLAVRDDVELVDLGEHELDESEEPMRLYAVREPVGDHRESLQDMLRDALFPLQLLDQEGEGGMGEIHLARDASLRRTLAVKVLRSELASDPGQRARFFREARVIAGLSHPNVVGIYSVGELADGTPYFVMDYVEGGSFADRVEEKGPLSLPEARRALGEVAAALEAAHQRGVVHRDIKASNVLFDPISGRAVVTDWGIAALDPAAAQMEPDVRLTRAGTVIGSPLYMSPEQLTGEQVGSEADLYALGLLAFDLLTGDGPFEASTPHGLMAAHLREEPKKLSAVRRDVDPELDELVSRCLSKVPRDRPTASDLRRRLAPGADSVLEWPPPGLDRLRGKALKVGGYWTVASILLLPLILVGLGSTSTGLAATWVGSSAWNLVVAAAGAVYLLAGLVVFGFLSEDWLAGIKLGYGWTTLAEVAADPRGDTGMLIVGGREYLTLPLATRTRLRGGRMAVAGLVLLIPLTMLLLIALSVVGAARGLLSARGIVVFTLVVPVALALAAMVIRDFEHRRTAAFRKALRKHATPRSALRRLVDPWYSSFEENRRGASPSRGMTGRPWVARWALLGAFVMLAAGSLVTLSLVTLAIGGPETAAGAVAKFSVTEARMASLGPGRSARLTVDSSLTAEDAAELLDRITNHGNLVDDSRTVAGGISTSPLVAGGGPLGSCGPEGRCWGIPLNPDSVVLAAFRGLSPAEQEYLRYITEDAIPSEWSRFARVGNFDDLAFIARQFGPDAAGLPWEEMYIPRYSVLREVMYVAMARAGLLISENRLPEAELLLRETLSVGLVLADQGTTLIVSLIGAVIGNHALEQLRLFYTLTGRAEDAARLAPAMAADSATLLPNETSNWDPWLVVSDSLRIPQLRWELIPNVQVYHTCGTVRGILFGLPDEMDSYMRGPLRGELVQSELQGRLYDQFFGFEERLAPGFNWSGDAPLLGLVWWTGRLIGSDRMSFCAKAFAANY